MATKLKTRHPAKDSSRNKSFDTSSFTFEIPNEPNADVLLTSLRAAGYSLESTIGDFVDNCIDAGASTVAINLSIDAATKLWQIEVADDGSGMWDDVLDQMMRLGSRTEHDIDTDLGAFGLGSDTAALAIGRQKHVVTRPEPDTWLSSVWDLDVVVKAQKFVKHMAKATSSEQAMFRGAFEACGCKVPETGTVVRISRCDRVGRRELAPAVRKVVTYVGQTYRRFLVPNGGLSVVVNGERVEPSDPMMRENQETMALLDEQFDFTWKDDRGLERTEKLGVFVVHLPDFGGQEANKDKGITIDRSGYYILRNGREISAGTKMGLFAPHNEFSRFRAEINVPAALDAQLGVTFLKSSTDVRPSQALRDRIDAMTSPYRRQSRALYLKSRKDAPETVPHEEAAKQIKARSPFLRRPEAEIEKRNRRDNEEREKRERNKTDADRQRTPRERSQKALADVAQFEAKALGMTAPFYEGTLIGRRVLVTYNSDHPAYQRLILENRDSRGQIAAVDFLVWSLVAAELRNVDENNARFMEAMREDASFNLRQLLTV